MKPQALNYTPKAIEALRSLPCPDAPWSRMGMAYIIEKLQAAEVFVLPEYGQLLDRGKARPEVPGVMFRPPFPVVALEYAAPQQGAPRQDDYWTACPCSRRIALAWDFTDDLPRSAPWAGLYEAYGPGIVVASIAYRDDESIWLPVFGAMHFAYEGEWRDGPDQMSPFMQAAAQATRINPKLNARQLTASVVPILPEAMQAMAMQSSFDTMADHIRADVMDEGNAYLDMCYALACRNISARRITASATLNKCRRASKKPLLKDFHILEIEGEVMTGGGSTGTGTSPRDHLRRGHIRRLGPDRVTWVNQTMVHGRGDFVGKAYSIGGRR